MIKKIYDCGCFDYQKFIFDKMKNLALNSDEAIILIKILDKYSISKVLSNDELISELPLTKAKIEKSLASLLERNFYEIYVNYNEKGIGVEYISIDGFFNKVNQILLNNNQDINNEIFKVNQYLTQEMNRVLTSQEIEIVNSLILEDRYTLEDIKTACKKIKDKNKLITMRNLAQALTVKEEAKQAEMPSVLKDFLGKIK